MEGVDPVTVLGPHDINLQQIELAYPAASISARGNIIRVSGTLTDFQEIRNIVNELVGIAQRTGVVSERDIRTVITIRRSAKPQPKLNVPVENAPVSADGSLPLVSTPEESGVIVYTHGGGAVRAKTANQRKIVESHFKNDIVFAIGPAGTGKTYTAVALAVKALKERQVKRIVLCRPAVEAGESLGFLPGDLKDKIDPYLRPLYDSLEEMIDHDRLEINLSKNIIEIVPLAYMRGRTLNNAFVILDEAQNATTTQMKMFLTRLGINSKAIITGDVTQTDLPKKMNSGLIEIPKILGKIKGIDFVYLDQSDVVRHKLIRDIIEAYERYEHGGAPSEKTPARKQK
ncbi:MAG: PhoH family protein [Bacteroidetes bacterium]|nr:PhoH family protein [Bacteroidota bacterium]